MSLQSRFADLIAAIGADVKQVRIDLTEEYTFSMAGVLTTKVGPMRVYLERACIIDTVRVAVGTAPTGGTVIVDVNRNGATIYGTQANRPTIAAAGVTALGGAYSNGTYAIGDYITVDVDTITAPAADLSVVVRVRKT